MTPDDFKQKCDEIHRVVCYFLGEKINLTVMENSCWIGQYRLDRPVITKSAIHYGCFIADWFNRNV